jgi:hypothetical protein
MRLPTEGLDDRVLAARQSRIGWRHGGEGEHSMLEFFRP